MSSNEVPNETVEKPIFAERNALLVLYCSLLGTEGAWNWAYPLPGGYWSAPKAWILPI